MRTPPRSRFRNQPKPRQTDLRPTVPEVSDAAASGPSRAAPIPERRAGAETAQAPGIDRRAWLSGAGMAGLATGALGFAGVAEADEPAQDTGEQAAGERPDPRRLQAPDTAHTRTYYARARF